MIADKHSHNLLLAKAMLRRGVTKSLIRKAVSISEYQLQQLLRELQAQGS